MNQQLSRRRFLLGAGSTVAAFGTLLIGGVTPAAQAVVGVSAVELSDAEHWLLSTAADDLDASVLSLITGAQTTTVFLPMLQH